MYSDTLLYLLGGKMSMEPVWPLLGIIIAIIAIIAEVRRRIIDRINKIKKSEEKNAIKQNDYIDETKNQNKIIEENRQKKNDLTNYAVLLLLADVPLAIAGLLIALHNSLLSICSEPPPILRIFDLIAFNFALIAFNFALLVLTLFLIHEWYKSIIKFFCKDK